MSTQSAEFRAFRVGLDADTNKYIRVYNTLPHGKKSLMASCSCRAPNSGRRSMRAAEYATNRVRGGGIFCRCGPI
eukprot:441702-Prorocentrum_minimum.AAC.1